MSPTAWRFLDEHGVFLALVYPAMPSDLLEILQRVVLECLGLIQTPINTAEMDMNLYDYISFHFSLYNRMGVRVSFL